MMWGLCSENGYRGLSGNWRRFHSEGKNWDGGFPVAQTVKRLPAMQETWVQFLRREDPLEKEMATTPVFLPGESHRQRNLVGYSPWGHKSRI